MKIIKYTLTPHGTIPDYVIDGGYLATSNGNLTPQNLNLIGVALDKASEVEFATEANLLEYAQGLDLHFANLFTNEEIPLDFIVGSVWARLLAPENELKALELIKNEAPPELPEG